MLPDGERGSSSAHHDADSVDPYIVSIVTETRAARYGRKAEAIRVVEDEMHGTSTRRRAQLLNSRR